MKLNIPSPHELWIRLVCCFGILVLLGHHVTKALVFSITYSFIYFVFNYLYLYIVVQYASRNLVLCTLIQKLSGIMIFSLLYRNLLKGVVLALAIEICQYIASYLNPQKKGV